MSIKFKTTKKGKFKALEDLETIYTLVGSIILNFQQIRALEELGVTILIDGKTDKPSSMYPAKGVFE